jgi:hypothetical protein
VIVDDYSEQPDAMRRVRPGQVGHYAVRPRVIVVQEWEEGALVAVRVSRNMTQ